MQIRRWVSWVVLAACGTVLLLNVPVAADKRISDIVALSDTYSYAKNDADASQDTVEVRNPLFNRPAIYTASGALIAGGNQAEIRCRGYTLYSRIHIGNDIMAKLRSGWRGEVTYELTVNNADLISQHCPDLVKSLKENSRKTSQDSGTVAKTVDDKAQAAAAQAIGRSLEGKLAADLGDAKAEFVKKDRPGCATIGGSRNCDEAWRNTLGRCVLDAKKRAASQYTSTDAAGAAKSTEYLRKFFGECLSKEIYGNTSQASSMARLLNKKGINLREEIEAGEKAVSSSLDEQLKSSQAALDEERHKQGAEEKATCGSEVTGIGWMMCPLLEAMSTFADGMWKLFEGLLQTNPLEGQPGHYLYELWAGFRNIANSILVLVFLIIIASQVSGIGISNYGIKKMIPRVIIAAVAINASFFLMQIAVDMANVLGSSLYKTIVNAGNFNTAANLDRVGVTGLLGDIITAGKITFVTGAGVAAAGVAVGMPAALMFMALLLIPAVIGFVAGVLALIIRSALIPVIAVIAPVAIAAYVLPNTQGIFDKWRKTTTAMLSLYPLASVYYGGLKLAALIMISTGGTGPRLIGMIVLLGGAVVVMILAVKANAITGKIAGAIQGGLNKLTSPVQQNLSESFGESKKEGMQAFKYGRDRRGLFGAVQRGMRRFDRSKRDRALRSAILESEGTRLHAEGLVADQHAGGGRLKGLESSVAGQAYMKQQESAIVKQQEGQYRGQSLTDLEASMLRAFESGDYIQAQAIQNLMAVQGGRGLEAFNRTVVRAEAGDLMSGKMRSSLAENLAMNHAGTLAKDFATRQWAQTSDTMTKAQAEWTGLNDNTSSVSAKDFSEMSTAAQMRLLGASVTRNDKGEVVEVNIPEGAGGSLDTNALRALLDSSTDLGEGITRGGDVDVALRTLLEQREAGARARQKANEQPEDSSSG